MHFLKKIVFSVTFFLATVSIQAQDLHGSWSGTLEVMGQRLPLHFHFEPVGNDWQGTMDSPNQGAKGIKLSKVLYNGMMLTFEVAMAGITYEGIWVEPGFKGTFKQGGLDLPLNLERMEVQGAPEPPKRPQTPQEPFDYEIIETNFKNLSEDITLYGTLTKPRGSGPFPAVVLVTGSGPQNRNSEIFGHQSFWVIADYLTRQGIAVLRYDERGVGESEGVYENSTSEDFKNDAQLAVAHLRKFPWTDQAKVGVIGHSEGGLISWMMGAEGKGLNFIVSLAGPVVPIPQLMAKQTADVSRSSGNPQELVERHVALNRRLYQAILESSSIADAKEKVEALAEEMLLESGLEGEQAIQQQQGLKEALLNSLNPWFYNFIRTNPENYITQIKLPVFAAFGEKDIQVNAAQNANRLQELLGSKQGQLDLKVYPDLNHLFQHAETGSVAEYQTIEETFNQQVLVDIVAFIQQQ
jgi:uncharacterized protein